jgi:hypothetical protein
VRNNKGEIAMRKVYVEVKVKLILNMDDGIEVSDVIDEMDYNFTSTTTGADVYDSTIEDHEVTDSK